MVVEALSAQQRDDGLVSRSVAENGARSRKVGVIAVARKHVIALWRLVERAIIPAGAVLRTR
jgi:hypothetical protein